MPHDPYSAFLAAMALGGAAGAVFAFTVGRLFTRRPPPPIQFPDPRSETARRFGGVIPFAVDDADAKRRQIKVGHLYANAEGEIRVREQ